MENGMEEWKERMKCRIYHIHTMNESRWFCWYRVRADSSESRCEQHASFAPRRSLLGDDSPGVRPRRRRTRTGTGAVGGHRRTLTGDSPLCLKIGVRWRPVDGHRMGRTRWMGGHRMGRMRWMGGHRWALQGADRGAAGRMDAHRTGRTDANRTGRMEGHLDWRRAKRDVRTQVAGAPDMQRRCVWAKRRTQVVACEGRSGRVCRARYVRVCARGRAHLRRGPRTPHTRTTGSTPLPPHPSPPHLQPTPCPTVATQGDMWEAFWATLSSSFIIKLLKSDLSLIICSRLLDSKLMNSQLILQYMIRFWWTVFMAKIWTDEHRLLKVLRRYKKEFAAFVKFSDPENPNVVEIIKASVKFPKEKFKTILIMIILTKLLIILGCHDGKIFLKY